MSFLYFLTWRKIRAFLLAMFILLFVIGVFILMNTGKQMAPMQVEVSSANGEDFGKFLTEHYALLAPFFDKNRQDFVTEGEPLLIRVMGDIILLNLAIGWILAASIAFGFSSYFAPSHAKPLEAITYATWRLGLDIVVFLMASLGTFGWEQLNLPIPVGFIILLFIAIDIFVQSFLVVNIYGTTASVSTMFCIILSIIVLLAGALITGSVIKKRLALMLAQFVDVPSVTLMLKDATAEGNRELQVAIAAKDDASQSVATAQAKLDQIRDQQTALEKDIETKKNSEAYVYGRIIRIRAQGDLVGARDQLTAFLTKFANGTLVSTAKAQLDLINQDLANQEAQKKQAEADAALAVAQGRADLLARAAQGEVTLLEMRHALLSKNPDDIKGLFGQPTEVATGRWSYSQKMLINPQTNEKTGLTIYFVEGAVQSVDYFYGK